MAYQAEFSLHPFIPQIDFVAGFKAYREKYYDPFTVYQYDPADVPTEAVVVTSHKTVPDFVPINGMLSVCPEVHALIEELEPGVHEFFPVQIKPKNPKRVLLRRDGRSLTEPYYLLNIQIAIDAVCIEQSQVKVIPIAPGITLVNQEGKVVLYRNMISGHHVWRGHRQLTISSFFSDILVKKVKAERFKGLEFGYINEV